MKSNKMIIFALAIAIVTSLMILGAHKTKEEPKLYSDIRKATHIFVDSRNWRWRGLPSAGDYTKNNFTVIKLCKGNGGDVLEVFAKYYLHDSVGAEGLLKELGFRREATSYYEGLDLWKKPEQPEQ